MVLSIFPSLRILWTTSIRYDRRSKSLELLKGFKVLATTPEDQEDQERSTGPEQKRPSRPLSGLGRLKSFKRPAAPLQSDWQVVELEPRATGGESDKQTTRSSSSSSSHATITTHPPPVKMAQDPSPKKKGFFRRLSLSTSSHKAQVTPNGTSHLVKSSRTVSGGARKDPMLAGPAYDTLPPGAAPSAYREVRQDGSKDPRKGKHGWLLVSVWLSDADTPPSQHLFQTTVPSLPPNHHPALPFARHLPLLSPLHHLTVPDIRPLHRALPTDMPLHLTQLRLHRPGRLNLRIPPDGRLSGILYIPPLHRRRNLPLNLRSERHRMMYDPWGLLGSSRTLFQRG